jgi:hypothetical protein
VPRRTAGIRQVNIERVAWRLGTHRSVGQSYGARLREPCAKNPSRGAWSKRGRQLREGSMLSSVGFAGIGRLGGSQVADKERP